MAYPLKLIATLLIFALCTGNFFGQTNSELKITHLTTDFYIFTTYKMFGTTKQSSNGMYIVTDIGVVLIDTPWDTSPFQPLLDSIKVRHHKKVIMCISTHSHEDRTSGLDYYKRNGIKTFTTKQTDEISKKDNRPRAEFVIEKDTTFSVGQHKFETYYPGQGHTRDNIVIWFNKEKILYGGCLVKSSAAKDLGYVDEANIKEWPETIKKVQAKFPNPNFIIPGHYDWAGTKALVHTLKLLYEYTK